MYFLFSQILFPIGHVIQLGLIFTISLYRQHCWLKLLIKREKGISGLSVSLHPISRPYATLFLQRNKTDEDGQRSAGNAYICRPHLLKRLSMMICKWTLTSARLVRAADESPVAEEGGPGAAALEAQAVVEVRQGGLRGLCCLPSSFFFFFHFLDDGRKHGGIGNCPFIGRQLPVTLWALWFSLKRQYRKLFN